MNTEESKNKKTMSSKFNNSISESTKKSKTTQLFETLLGSKLILTENSNMLIEKPFTIFEILSIIRTNSQLDLKLEVIEKLKQIISKLHSNALIIVEKSVLKDDKSEVSISFMNELIDILLENSREPKLIESLLDLLKLIIFKSGTQITYFWDIFQRISKLCEDDKHNYDGTKFLLMLRIINTFFTKNIYDEINYPSKFLFFNNNNSELRLDADSLQAKNINLTNGFTIGVWIYPEKINLDSSNKNINCNSVLFYINTNKNSIIQVTVEDDKLYYICKDNSNITESQTSDTNVESSHTSEILNEDPNSSKINVLNINEELKLIDKNEKNSENNEKNYLCDIEYNVWFYLVFTHKPVAFLQKPQFILYKNSLNDPLIFNINYPNFGNQKITNLGLCKGFTGLMSNAFMFNEALTNSKMIEDLMNFKFGLYNEQNINIFKKYIEQKELNDKSNSEKNKNFALFQSFFKSVIFIYSPCRIKNNNCIDLVNNINAEISINNELNLVGGYYKCNTYGRDIYYLGGASIFLPIFDYIFSSNYNSPVILEEGIKILTNIFSIEKLYLGNKVDTDEHFFENIFYLINKNIKLPENLNNFKNVNDSNDMKYDLFNKEIMYKFFELAEILIKNDKSKKYSESFFCNILFNPKILNYYSLAVQKELYKKTKDLYIENCEYMNEIFDVRRILDIIIYLYDNNNNYYCCEKHYRMCCDNNSNINKNNNTNIITKIHNPNLLNKIFDLIEILKFILTNTKIITISQMQFILQILTMEISPCLQFSLIKILHLIFGLDEIINPRMESETNTFLLSMENEYIKAFIDCNGVDYLLNLITKSTLDVRYETIKMFYLICSEENWVKKLKNGVVNELLPYLCLNIFQDLTKINDNDNKSSSNNINDIIFPEKDDFSMSNENENNDINVINTNNSTNIEIEDIIRNLSIPMNYLKNCSNKINDSYVEKIYQFFLEWLINKFDSSFSLDDSDEIYYESALNNLMYLVQNNNICFKVKFLRDLYTLCQYNHKNSQIILKNKHFQQWILDLILFYQILSDNNFKNKNYTQQGNCESIIVLGIKLHNTIIINTTLYEQELEDDNENKSSSNNSTNNYSYIFQFPLIWLHKIQKIGKLEYNSANILINNIITDLLEKFKNMINKENILNKSYIWISFLNLTLISYEFYYVLDFYNQKKTSIRNSSFSSTNSNNFTNELEFVNNKDIYSNFQNNDFNNSATITRHKEILLIFYECFKNFWDKELTLENDFGENYQSIELLLDNKIFEMKSDEYSIEMNILLYSSDELPFQDIKENNIMKSIFNIIILFLKSSTDNNQKIKWIQELRNYLMYLIIISHNINPASSYIVDSNFITNMQDNISQIIVIAIYFLNHEIKNNNFTENNNENDSSENIITKNTNQNNDETIIKEYLKVFRSLIISYILVVEKILIEKEREKNNTGGFWYGLTTALSTLKNFVWKSIPNNYEFSCFLLLYKNIYLSKKNEPLFNLDEIAQFKINNFFEVIQKINDNENWKFAFFNNINVINIINNQFCINYYEKNTKIRVSNGDNIHINNNVCFSDRKYVESRNKEINNSVSVALSILIKNIKDKIFYNTLGLKKSQNNLKTLHKKYFCWKGKWNNYLDYIRKVENGDIKFKIGNHYTNDFICPCLYSIDDIWDYLPNFSKYNPSKNLFLDIKIEDQNSETANNIKKANNKNIITSNKSFTENNNSIRDSNISVKENKKSPNYDKYTEIQKLLKYTFLFNSTNYNKCAVDLTKIYIEKIKTSNIKDAKKSIIYSDCCLVKLKGHIPGCLLVTANYVYFITNYFDGEVQYEKCVGSLFNFEPDKHKSIREIKKIDIKQIFKKRYYYTDNSLEIFTNNNKSYYIKFNKKRDRDEFYKIITNSGASLLKEDVLSITKKWENWDISTMAFLSFLNNFGSRSYKDLTQYPVFPWIIKDYESKKLNVFNETNIRQLQKPIGALGSEKRLSIFMQNYNESKELEINENNEEINQQKNEKKNDNEDDILNMNINNLINNLSEKDNIIGNENIEDKNNNINTTPKEKKYFYSSHYSNPFYVVHYMYKLFPYSCCAIELQGDGFDKPERQFISMALSWKNCMNENTDIRELIPEFYYLPEMFKNINKINFDSRNKNNNISYHENFEYPFWAKNNSNLLVIKNRLALESDFVSYNLNDWVDLIFGYKQKGIEAEKAINLFFDFTYEGSIDIEKFKNNKDEYNSLISKVDIGQTPSQIFHNHVQKRLKRKELNQKKFINFEKLSELKSHSSQSEKINSISYNSSYKELSKKMLIYIKSLKNQRLLCVFNNGIVLFLKEESTLFSESGLVFINEKMFKIPSSLRNYQNGNIKESPQIIEEDFDIMTEIDKSQPITSIKNGKYIIKGGYYDCKFMIHETSHVYSNKYTFIYLDDDSQIILIKSDNENENYLYVGTTNGKIFIYKINQKNVDYNDLLIYDSVISDHNKCINDLYIDTKLNIIATVASDKTCNLYTYPSMRLFRVILLNEVTSLDNVLISNSPLASVIIYSKNESIFNVYTINGSFILKKKNAFKEIYSPRIVKDVYDRDYLIYGTKYKVFVVCRLPLFTKEEFIEIKNDNYNFPIKCIELREQNEILYFWRLHNYNLSYLKSKSNITNGEGNKKDNINLYI